MIGHKHATEAVGLFRQSVGEHSDSLEAEGVSHGGAAGKANVGISNDKGGEKPPRRKTQGS